MPVKTKKASLYVRGFLRAQITENGRVVGDSGWIKNKLTNAGLTNMGLLLAGSAGSYVVGYMRPGTQTDAVNMTQTDILGATHSYKAVNISTSGTMTVTYTASFGSASLAASCAVGGLALFSTNTVGTGMFAMQTFATSAWNTNQDFNATYQIRFATA